MHAPRSLRLDQGGQTSTAHVGLLIHVLSPSTTIAKWRAGGVLHRETHYLRALARHCERLIVVNPEPAADSGVDLGPTGSLISGTGSALVAAVANTIGPVDPSRVCVIRTQEFDSAGLALAIRERLIAAGHRVCLIARGTYPWSRRVVSEFGPDSNEAHDAGSHEGMLARLADSIIGSSIPMVADLEWRYQTESTSSTVIPRFISPDVPIRSADERERRQVVSVGALMPRQRHATIIESIAALPESVRQGVNLLIIGEGPEHSNLLQLAETLTVPVTIEPLSCYTTVIERLSRCTLYCHLAAADGAPPALLDAMASACTVIVADVAGLGRLVEHGFSGLRVPVDSSAIARALEGLLDDQAWRDAMGTAAMNAVRTPLDPDGLAAQEIEAISKGVSRYKTLSIKHIDYRAA
jgi:glycosyltransferase involved in cell wall biosynthesis